MDKINSLREKIKNYDIKILALFEKRFEACLELAKQKQKLGMKISQPLIEQNLKLSWLAKKNDFLTEDFLNKLFPLITNHSKDLQSKIIKSSSK